MIFALLLTGFGVTPAAANNDLQGRTITVTVTDRQGPVPGANVVVVDRPIGGATDADGVITLTKVPAGAVIEVSFVGYVTKKVSVGNKSKISVYLEEDQQKLDAAVAVAYGHQKKITVTGAIETVTNEELIETQVPNFANALAGRVAGLTTIQESGQPGRDDVTVYLRGQGTASDNTPLLLIDGVPSDGKADKLGMLDVNEVASVTILKDAASTAIFGTRGANGVILITTRRGDAGKTVLDAQVTTSVSSLHFPWTRLHSWEHAELRNQARANDGFGPDFTDYQVAKFREQSGDPFFPDRDMYKEAIAKFAPMERINVNMSGGSKKTRYFSSANIINQSGNTKILPRKVLGYNAQFNMLRYTLRNNFDFNLNERLMVSLTLSIYYQRTNEPVGGTGVFGTAMETPPTNPGPLTVAGYLDSEGNEVPAGVIVARQNSSSTSAWATVNRSGYYCNTSFSLLSQATVTYDFSKIIKGLTMSANVAYNDFAASGLSGYLQGYDAYSYYQAKNPGEKSYYISTVRNTNETFAIGERGIAGNQMLQLHFRLNYDQQFGDHAVGAMIFAQSETKLTNVMHKLNAVRTSLPYKFAGISGRITWNYKTKYLAEFDAGYNGSEQFHPKKRFGFFPAFSAGWVITNEPFMRNVTWLNTLKFRGSIGLVGNDQLGGERFMYYTTVSKNAGGAAGSLWGGKGVGVEYLGNPDVSWETVLKQNYAFDFAFLKHFSGKVDIFFENCNNRLYTPFSMPSASGIAANSVPRQNIGITNNHGFEIELNWGKEFSRKFRMNAGGQFSYARAKIVYCDEVLLDESYAYRKRTEGFMPGQLWGLAIDYSNGNGYINTQEELDRCTEMYAIGAPRFGDFIYKDIGGARDADGNPIPDGVIDDKDIVPIKNSSTPNITFGFNVGATYKRFGISAQFNGMGMVSAYRMGLGVSELGNAGTYTDYHLRAWTKERYENGERIDYPALSTRSNPSLTANDFFINNRSYLRLKNIVLSYSIPPNKLFRALGVARGTVSLYGNNVFIIDNQRVKAVDAETSGQSVSYPLNRTYTMQLDIKF
ncbi:MAG: TonB-dependent receptor [Bacteroidales bacterium]|nr:TonB-dependent receptor [Bacteroidales bacterium]